MINSVINEFCQEDLLAYLNRMFRILFDPKTGVNEQKTYVHVCAFHVLRNNREKIKKFSNNNKSLIHFGQRVLGCLICYKNIESATTFAQKVILVVSEDIVTKSVSDALNHINHEINENFLDDETTEFIEKCEKEE